MQLEERRGVREWWSGGRGGIGVCRVGGGRGCCTTKIELVKNCTDDLSNFFISAGLGYGYSIIGR